MKVSFRLQALRDLEAIRDYVAVDNPRAADAMYRKLKSACDRLADFPHVGRVAPGGKRELATVWPYIISYQVGTERVSFLKMIHGARLR